jgi:hypothetical protein
MFLHLSLLVRVLVELHDSVYLFAELSLPSVEDHCLPLSSCLSASPAIDEANDTDR